MATDMINNFVQYCIQEFNFNPKTIKEERNNVAVREKDFHNSEERKLKY